MFALLSFNEASGLSSRRAGLELFVASATSARAAVGRIITAVEGVV